MNREYGDRLLTHLVQLGGSDLHLKVGSPPRVRIDGALLRISGEPILQDGDLIEIAGATMSPKVAAIFDERSEADFAYSIAGVGRFRVNAFRQRGAIGMVFRAVRPGTSSIEELGLPSAVQALADEQRGIVLVTGPTGSGKTTTLAAMIDYINRNRECHIVTIEDPIEVLHDDHMASIDQREVGVDTESFSIALRSALRQDPDVILVGEMRDAETVSTALTAAETGHLVLSTLHTGDSVETINRIIDFFPPAQHRQARVSLASALRGSICQRLIPRSDGVGRVATLEVMVVNGRIQQCIIDAERTAEIADIVAEGGYYGMQTFAQSLTELFRGGLIDLETALANSPNPHDFTIALQREGLVAAYQEEVVGAGAPDQGWLAS